MKLWSCRLVFLVLSAARLSSSQQVGEACIRRDRTQGTCRDIGDCVGDNGQIENAGKLELCKGSTLAKVIACCRKTPESIASEKCEKWKRQANEDGSQCRVNIPLARGGTEADVGEFPHMVSILTFRDGDIPVHVCGGVLISDRYVLSAAHCKQGDQDTYYVRVGGHRLNQRRSGIDIDSKVIDFIQHPEYKPPRRYNDIALLKLAITVEFSRYIRAACLPHRDVRIRSGTKMIIAGWGLYDRSGQTSDVLRKAEVTVIDRIECDKNPQISDVRNSLEYPVGITDSIICANETKSGACTGDSGGPLMVATRTTCDVKEVVGLVSRGLPDCQQSDVPGTCTRVEYYVDWIVRLVWPDEL
uniref:Trypsin-like serine protease n=1 Tax=Macrobrachium nipponense TaxID=159736 RepID=A0A186XKD4_MACNP|nr:trypsin-like serine protease [Macrobrachium nipponense]